MKTYEIVFKAINIHKETLICSSFIRTETLFMAIHSFEEKNRGRGYETLSVSELMTDELTAAISLKKNINFWFNDCGLKKENVVREINGWFNFAYTMQEQEDAKRTAITELAN